MEDKILICTAADADTPFRIAPMTFTHTKRVWVVDWPQTTKKSLLSKPKIKRKSRQHHGKK